MGYCLFIQSYIMNFKAKTLTLNEYITYRNYLINKARARSRAFNSKKESYYDIRLKNLDYQYPEFKGKGLILKK